MNKNTVKKFVKDHKIEIACACLGGVAGAITVVKVRKGIRDRVSPVPESLVKYGFKTIVEDYDGIQLMVEENLKTNAHSIPLSDLGKFGEALCDIPGIDITKSAWIMIDVAK